MAVTSINSLAKKAIVDALELAGYTVYTNILEHHSGVRTKSSEYIEIGRPIERINDEITIDCIQGEMDIELKYYKPSAWNGTANTESYTFEDACIDVEKALAGVKSNGMFTRFNMDKGDTTTPHNRGLECRWTLSCTMASRQDREIEVSAPVNTVLPSITPARFVIKDILTVDVGTWTGSPTPTYTYQWYRSEGLDSPFNILVGAVGNQYQTNSSDAIHRFYCEVTATNSVGTASADSTESQDADIWIPSDASLTAWYDASDETTITESGGFVSMLADKTGLGNDLEKLVPSDQPQTGVQTLNGLNTLLFDGVDDCMDNENFPMPTSGNIAMFAVGDVTGSVNNEFQSAISFDAVSNDFQFDAGSNTQFVGRINCSDIASSVTFSGGGIGGASSYVLSFDFDGSTVEGYVDGGLKGSTNDYNAKINPVVSLDLMENRAGTLFLGGYMGELVFIEDVTEATRQRMEGYLAWKWGLQDKLPSNHPYRFDGTLFGYQKLWTPSELTTIEAWFDAFDNSTLTPLTSSKVSSWSDKSGNGYTATQTNDSKRPVYGYNFNNYPSLTFNDDNLTTNLEQLTTTTIFMVTEAEGKGASNNNTALGANDEFSTGGLNTVMQGFSTGNATYNVYYGSQLPQSQLRYNGADITGQAIAFETAIISHYATGVSTENKDYIIGDKNPPTPTNAYKGKISEILIFNTVLDTDDTEMVEGYLAWKWGLEDKLPSSHPYKTEPPKLEE